MISHGDEFDGWAEAVDGYVHQKQRWQASYPEKDMENDAEEFGLPVQHFAQIKIAEHLETISYFLYHLVKFAERNDSKPKFPVRRKWTNKRRDMVAEFGPFLARYIARNGEVSEQDALKLYQDFHGVVLAKEDEKGCPGK